MRVRVERIGRGRRRPDVEYVETRSPRKWPAEKQDANGFGGLQDARVSDQPHSGLRLPWRINRRSE